MRKVGRFLCLMLVGLLLQGATSTVWAQEGEAESAKGKCAQLREDIAGDDNDGVWLVEYIVTCIKGVIAGDDRYGIEGAFEKFLQAFYDAVERPVQMSMTLAVCLFGGLLLTGMIEKNSRDSFMFLLKLACVAYFIQVSVVQQMYDAGVGAMDDLTDMVFTFGKGEDGICKSEEDDVLWDRIDCMLDVMIGIHKKEYETADGDTVRTSGEPQASPEQEGLSRGMLHFFFTNMASGGTGAVVIGALGLYTVFSLIFAVIKTIHTYLAAVLALAFLLIMMPMFIPLLLFRATRNYFDKWYRIGISFILQPVILFGFVSLMMIALDTVLVSGDNSVLKMICNDSENKVLNECMQENGVYQADDQALSQYRLTANRDMTPQLGESLHGAANNTRATAQGSRFSDDDLRYMVETRRSFDSVDYERLGSLMGSDESEVRSKLAYGAIIMALTMFVFLSMLNYIPILATDLAGGVFEVPNLYEKVGSNFLGADQAERLAQQASHSIRTSRAGQLVRQFEGMVSNR